MPGRLQQLMCAYHRALEYIRAFLQPGDEVLLIDAGVHLLTDPDALFARLKNEDYAPIISALGADVLSRGLEAPSKQRGIRLLSDGQWVERVCHCAQVLSWK